LRPGNERTPAKLAFSPGFLVLFSSGYLCPRDFVGLGRKGACFFVLVCRRIFNDGLIYAYADLWITGDFMNRLLFLGLFLASSTPLYAQGAQPDAAKLKADAQKVVSIIKGNKDKTQAYCQISELAEQIGEADQEKDSKKAEALSRQIFELEVKLGPEYISLVSSLKDLDPNSQQAKEIDSILAPLDD